MMAGWEGFPGWAPWWDLVTMLAVAAFTVVVARAIARRRNRDGGRVTGYLLRRRGTFVTTWKVSLSDGRRSRLFLTRRGAMSCLRRNVRPGPVPRPDVSGQRTGRLLWDPPQVRRIDDERGTV